MIDNLCARRFLPAFGRRCPNFCQSAERFGPKRVSVV